MGGSQDEQAGEFWKGLFGRLSAKLSAMPVEYPRAFPKNNEDTANRGKFHAINLGVSYGGGNLVSAGIPLEGDS